MQTIKLKYINRKEWKQFSGPATWDELTEKQFLYVVRAKTLVKDITKQALILGQLLFDIPARYIREATHLQKLTIAGTMNYIYEEQVAIRKWFFKLLLVNFKKYYGPADELDNLTFGELMFADENFRRYQKTKDIRYIDQLIAILYRRRGTKEHFSLTGDVREPFNKAHIERNAKLFKYLKDEIKQAILINYIGCRSIMAEPFGFVFQKIDEDDETDKPATNGSWLDVAIQLARKEQALGNLLELENQNAYLVLKVLDKVIEEHEEMERQMNSTKI